MKHMIPQSEISTLCRNEMAKDISMKKRSSNLAHIRAEVEHYTSDLPKSATFGTRIQALGNDLGLTPRQYLCKMETDRREARRAKKGDVRVGELVVCSICGYSAKTIANHLMHMHGLTTGEYKDAFAVERVTAGDTGFSAGSENPAFGHGGAFSPWSKKFIRGYDGARHNEFKKKHSSFQTNNPGNHFSRAFYDSDAEYSHYQKRDLPWFIEKFGAVEGPRRHALKTERWAKAFRSCSYSMISQELFNAIDVPGAYYATKNMPDMDGYKNKEYILSGEQGTFRLDFYVPSTLRAIEFDGDYWHSEARVNPERERRRSMALGKAGVTVYRVREQDFKKDKLGTIKKCIQFLKQ